MGETEVTQAEYFSVMGDTPSDFLGCGNNCPTEQVSWHDAAVFVNALSFSEGLMPCYSCSTEACEPSIHPYDCSGYRLPTEAKWEAAARCDEDWMYVGGDDIENVGWYYENSDSTNHPAGQKSPNACGLYDMSGNIWEWVHDGYDVYTAASVINPIGPESVTNRVYRGGSYADFVDYTRVSFRSYAASSFRGNRLGFRLARSAH